MAWDVTIIRHNASVLYNHLCSDDAHKVYVDGQGSLQVDERSFLWRFFLPLGETSMEAIDNVAILTLRRVLNALEAEILEEDKIIIQERNPVGLFMDEEEEAAGSLQALMESSFNPDAPLASTTRPPANQKWLNRKKFGMNIGNSSRFNKPMPMIADGPRIPDEELTREQLVCRKVTTLTQMIIHGKDVYKTTCGDFGYDVSDDEGARRSDL